MFTNIFLAGVAGAIAPHVIHSLRSKTRRAPLLLIAGFAVLSGYLSEFVFECQSPLHALALGLVLDELLMACRFLGVSQINRTLRKYS